MNTIVFDIETRPSTTAINRLLPPFAQAEPSKEDFIYNPADLKLGNVVRDKGPRDKFVAALVAKTSMAKALELLDEKHREKAEAAVKDAKAAVKDKLAAAIKKHEEAEGDYYARVHDKAALSPLYSTVCAIGWQIPGCAAVCMIVGDNVEDEESLIRAWIEFVCEAIEQDSSMRFQFWDASMNIHSNFDLNHLEKACIRLGIKLPAHFWTLPGQRGSIFENLRLVFGRHGGYTADGGYPDYLGLNRAVEINNGFGMLADEVMRGDDLVVKNKEDLDADGAGFWKFVEEGEMEAARAYLTNDIAATRFLANLHPFRAPSGSLAS